MKMKNPELWVVADDAWRAGTGRPDPAWRFLMDIGALAFFLIAAFVGICWAVGPRM